MTRIISEKNQKIPHEIKTIINDYFVAEFMEWKEMGQENLSGVYTLTVCEEIEKGSPVDFVSLIITKNGQDGGYLHVYGLREKVELIQNQELDEVKICKT